MTHKPAAKDRINAVRDKLGAKLRIFGHHYQHDSVLRHTDRQGDSLELSRLCAETDAEHIVFCGVHFMGESAALLARPGQRVYLPEPAADCVMSRTAPANAAMDVLRRITAAGRAVIPLAYVNTSVALKAVCGRHRGAVCTSANAETMMRWALDAAGRDGAVLFIPDKNLGSNTADRLNIPESLRLKISIREHVGLYCPQKNEINQAKLLLWPGCCAIHARFKPEQIAQLRKRHPKITIIAHPECSPDVIACSDAFGSTSRIIRYVEEAPDGAVIGIGTEWNLVHRLAQKYAGRKTILPLARSLCSHMAKVTEEKLADILEAILDGSAVPVSVDPRLAEPAKATLTRMLDACR